MAAIEFIVHRLRDMKLTRTLRQRLYVTAALSCCMAAAASSAEGQQGSGQRPPFQTAVEALLDAIAEPTPQRVQSFNENHLTPTFRNAQSLQWHVAQLTEWGAALGRAQLINLVLESPNERRATVRSGVDGETYILLFRVTADMPPRIAEIVLRRGMSATRPASGAVSAEARARQLLDLAFNADPARAEAWFREAYAPQLFDMAGSEQHLSFLALIRDQVRDIEIMDVSMPSATEARALYRSRLTGEWRNLRIEIEPQAPNLVSAIHPPQLVAPPATHAPEPRTFSRDAARAALGAYTRKLADVDMFSGSVLVARAGDVLFHDAFGAASREFQVANNTDTRFGIGSINKMFTTVGILQLVEQKRIALSDPVSRHLPGVLPDDVASNIRIEHLLTHTSGLGDFLFTPEMESRARTNYRTIADYLPLLAETRPRFEPGTNWGYSNAGFLVLGAILERVSGLSYDEYVQRNVLDRAGMTQTASPDMDLVPIGFAVAYQREFARGQPHFRSDRYARPVRGTPAGGGFSTALDLYRFVGALHANRLLSPEMTQRMLSRKPELGSNNYGFGTQIFSSDGSRYGHTGGGLGTSAIVEYDAASDLLIIVLGNMNTGSSAVRTRARQIYGGDGAMQSW